MLKLGLIAMALLVASAVAPFSLGARAEPLEREECKELQTQQRSLLTPDVKAALTRGPDWVKEHLYDQDHIEKVREYLSVEEKVAFRCRTNGVRVPKPLPPSLPDRKPPVPTYLVEGSPKILAGVAATSFLPLRKPSLSAPETAEAEDTAEEATTEQAGDIDEPATTTTALDGEVMDSEETEPGPSQAVADSDKTAPPENKATQ
ncbi:MAG TPA: hypothetical protein VMW68_07420 [Methyloceanibacter sp.]|nr:hypothetical protein [Methyloceanibacter sp.]